MDKIEINDSESLECSEEVYLDKNDSDIEIIEEDISECDNLKDETEEIEDEYIDIPEDLEVYNENEYEFIRNDKGQLISASGDLYLKDGVRNVDDQRIVGDEDRREYDDGGHLIGTRFNGPGDKEFLIPQDSHVNRANYKSLENMWANELEKGNGVHVDIEPIYHGDSKRPDIITGRYDINESGRTIKEYFSMTNENIETDEFSLLDYDTDEVYPNVMDTDYEKYNKEIDENLRFKKDEWRK